MGERTEVSRSSSSVGERAETSCVVGERTETSCVVGERTESPRVVRIESPPVRIEADNIGILVLALADNIGLGILVLTASW